MPNYVGILISSHNKVQNLNFELPHPSYRFVPVPRKVHRADRIVASNENRTADVDCRSGLLIARHVAVQIGAIPRRFCFAKN